MPKQRRTTPAKRRRGSKSKKTAYRVANWAAYNASLVQRGDLTIWISDEVVAGWKPEPTGPRQRGGQVQYSDRAIECLLMLRAVFRLPYRQTEGLGRAVLGLLGAEVAVPDYTTLCKRSAMLEVALPLSRSTKAKHIVLDSTGLKVYGEGEWKVRQHGYTKRRTWRKLHLSVDAATQTIQAVVLTEAGVLDATAGCDLLEATLGPIDQVSGDGGYDKRIFYETCTRQGIARIAVPPQHNARLWQHGNSAKPPLPRDQNLRCIRQVGRKRWKVLVGYHTRSLAETAMFRFKTIFGNQLSARTFSRQLTEVRLKCAALNRMTQLGLPVSVRLA